MNKIIVFLLLLLSIGHSGVYSMDAPDGSKPPKNPQPTYTPFQMTDKDRSDGKNNLAASGQVGQGADVHAYDNQGRTPLHYAKHGHVDVVRFLLDQGADTTQPTLVPEEDEEEKEEQSELTLLGHIPSANQRLAAALDAALAALRTQGTSTAIGSTPGNS